MVTDTTSNANNGAQKEGVKALLSPQFSAYHSSGGWGQTQEYLGKALAKLQSHATAYKAEFPNLKEREAAELKIMEAEVVHSTYDEFGNAFNSAEYNAAAAKLEVVQGRLKELTKPVPLPNADTLKALHEFAVEADKDFAERNSYTHQLLNWEKLNPEVQERLFKSMPEKHRAEFIDNAEQGRLNRLMAEDMKTAEKCHSGEVKETAFAQEKYDISDLLNQPSADKAVSNVPVYDDDALHVLGYKPLVQNSPEFHTYLRQVARQELDVIKENQSKVQYNIDLARGVYPHMDIDIEHEKYYATTSILDGSLLGLASVAAGEAAGNLAIKGVAFAGGKLMANNVVGPALSGVGSFAAENAPLISGFTRKTSAIATPFIAAGGTSIAIDEIALAPLMVRNQDGSEITSSFGTPPLTKKEQGEMAAKVMKEDDIFFLSPAWRLLTFNGDFAEKHADLYLSAGMPIPSRCVSLEAKSGTEKAAEIEASLGAVDAILKNYNPREANFWKQLNVEIEKQPVLPMEINNTLAQQGQGTNIQGR